MRTLFEILDAGLTIVGHNSEFQEVVTWNGSCTFSMWDVGKNGEFEEYDIRTYGGSSPMTPELAREFANNWLNPGPGEPSVREDFHSDG